MRILQLGKFYPIRGGVEKVMYDLMTGLAGKGVECDMMCAESTGRGAVHNPDAGARILTFRTWAKVASTTIAPSMVNSLRETADTYDLIHVHHPDPMAAFALFCSGYAGPVVLHWHSDIIKSKPVLQFYKPLQEWLLKRADKIVTTSPAIKESSEHLKPYLNKTISIPIGIEGIKEDSEGGMILRDKYGYKKIILSIGRLVHYKGFKHLVTAAKYLPDDYIVIIGGEGPLLEELEALRDSLGVSDKVIFCGRIPDEDLAAYYSACDIFCLPSVMKTEAFGIVQIEAMSLGKPIVATTIPGSGTSWVNRHGVSGFNVEPGNPWELAKALYAIGGNVRKYRVFSAGARERFDTEFKSNLMIDRCLALYRNLVSKP